jgi:hypothetical protein
MEDLVNNTPGSATEGPTKSESTAPKKRKRIVLYNYVKST